MEQRGVTPAEGPPGTFTPASDAAERTPAPDARERGRAMARELRRTLDWRTTSSGPDPDLRGLDFSGEDLRGVDFTAAVLDDTSFVGARLAHAQFAWAQLSHADFAAATGVVGTQFARANLSGARLPDNVRFVAVDTADKVAEGTTKLFLAIMLVCAYSWLTISATLDAKLLTDTAVSKLPIVNAEVPIGNFFTLVPIVLVGMALLLMLQGQRLWAAMAESPTIFPDGSTMSDRSATWILGAWASERVAHVSRRGVLARLQARLFVVVGWWLVPATVAWFWGRYLHWHDWPGTLVQLLALTVGCGGAAAFLTLAMVTLPRSAPGRTASEPRRRIGPFVPAAAFAALVPLMFGMASYSAIEGVHRGSHRGALTAEVIGARPALILENAAPAVRTIIPRWMTSIGVTPVAQLHDAEVSTRALGGVADTLPESKASGAPLVGADLRFASAERVFLALADLRYTDLLGADLWAADLRGANLAGADFTGASLYGADLRRARAAAIPAVDRVDSLGRVFVVDTLLCSRTHLAAANLRYARLDGGDFRGASFDDALLEGAHFNKARLAHATFSGADLDGADFRGAIGLTADQVLQARHVEALFDEPMLAALRVKSPARFAAYDAAAIEQETERERLSGDDEPDSLNTRDRKERESLIRSAFDRGPPREAPADALAEWASRGVRKRAGGSVPAGCVDVRAEPAQR